MKPGRGYLASTHKHTHHEETLQIAQALTLCPQELFFGVVEPKKLNAVWPSHALSVYVLGGSS